MLVVQQFVVTLQAFKDLLGDSGVYFKNNNLEDLKQTVDRLVKRYEGIFIMNQKKHIENIP